MPDQKVSYELRSPEGDLLVAELERIPGYVQLEPFPGNTYLQPNGEFTPNYDRTNVDWDSQDTHFVHGEAQFLDEYDTVHLAGDVIIVRLDSDGTETTVSNGFNPGIEKCESAAWIATLTPAGRFTRALKYATWITGSTHDRELGLIPPNAETRIHNRAHEYAKTEGIHNLLQQILAALQE